MYQKNMTPEFSFFSIRKNCGLSQIIVTIILPIFIFLISLVPKIINISSGLTIDELQWLFRSQIFINAMFTGQISDTFITSHPGVTLMWLSGLSLKIFGSDSQSFLTFLTIARLPVIITTSLCIVLIYFLLSKITNYTLAFLSSLMISLDPFIISHSMIVQSDALLAMFICISLLSFYLFLIDKKFLFLCVSSFFSGLAILSKLSGLVVPFLIVMILFSLVFKKESVLKILTNIFLYTMGVIITLGIFWPVLLFSPVIVLKGVLFGGVTVTSKTGVFQLFSENQNGGAFLFGLCPGLDCGNLYYPVNILIKTSPLILCLGILSGLFIGFFVWALIKKEKTFWNVLYQHKNFFIFIMIFFLIDLAFLFITPKRSERYALPLFPFIDILIVISLVILFSLFLDNKIFRITPLKISSGIAILIILIQLFLIFPIAPYYNSYFNPLFFGGPANAPNITLIGLGEGNDLAAEYLNSIPNAKNISVIAQHPAFSPYFFGHTWQLRDVKQYSIYGNYSFNITKINDTEMVRINWNNGPDYIIFYSRYLQLGYDSSIYELFNGRQPEKVIKINNIDYAYIFKIPNETSYEIRNLTNNVNQV